MRKYGPEIKGGCSVRRLAHFVQNVCGGKISVIDTGSKQVIGFANGVNISNGIGYKYTRPVGNKAEPWWVVNLLEELDQPGEWCIDFSRNKLYFLMDAAGAPADNSVALSVSAPVPSAGVTSGECNGRAAVARSTVRGTPACERPAAAGAVRAGRDHA